MIKKTAPLERFNRKFRVTPEGCHEWFGACTLQSRPMFAVGSNKCIPAQRFIFEHVNGPIPDDHEVVVTCACRSCVNPDHLAIVTVAEHRKARSNKLVKVRAPQRNRARKILTWLQITFPPLVNDFEILKKKIEEPMLSDKTVWQRIVENRKPPTSHTITMVSGGVWRMPNTTTFCVTGT